MKRRAAHAVIYAIWLAFGLSIAFLFWSGRVRAATVAEIPNVAKLMDERGDCPRDWFRARGPEFREGCYRMEYPSYEIIIAWRDGKVVRYTEMQFEIYGELTP
jgi:hypothetical protein